MPKTCVAVSSRAICGGVTFFEFLILFFFFRNFKANMKKKVLRTIKVLSAVSAWIIIQRKGLVLTRI